jgi:hypothetical protein
VTAPLVAASATVAATREPRYAAGDSGVMCQRLSTPDWRAATSALVWVM